MYFKPKIGFVVLTGMLILLSAPANASAAQVGTGRNLSLLAPTNFTPKTYISPKYNAFDHDYYRAPKLAEGVDTPPQADFYIFTNQAGFQNSATGTIETVFTFDASASTDAETPASMLEVRWYFENSAAPDTYFSRAKSTRHTFKKAGTYNVKLEVLDKGGNIAQISKKIIVVENTSPIPFFKVEPVTGTENTVFHFDTSLSRDDQYLASHLEYRFDWDSDGKWDTAFQKKTHWYHRFNATGNYTVTMEVKDPDNQKAALKKDIVVGANTPPVASFSVRALRSLDKKNNNIDYEFDAAASFDRETPQKELFYRWDFHYNGPNDIIYDTAWSHSPKSFARFEKSEKSVVKLEVMDADGDISSAIYRIE